MTFDWTEYLKLAQELAGQATNPANEEAKLRSSISRAYYAAFCKARNHLRDIDGDSIPRSDVHAYVCNKFKLSTDKSRVAIGNELDRQRVRRNKADYDDSVTRLSLMAKMAKMSLKSTQDIIYMLSSL